MLTTWLHLFDFSPLCIFKFILKTSAREALPGENIGILLGFVEVVKGFHERLRPELASLSTFRQPSHPPVYHGDHDNDDSDDGDDDNNDDDNGDDYNDDDSSPTQSWNESRSAAGSFFFWITFKPACFQLAMVMVLMGSHQIFVGQSWDIVETVSVL